MKCNEMEEILSAYANDELSPEQREMVETHLAGCADCREKLAGYRQTRQQLKTLRAVPFAPDIKATMMSRIKSARFAKKPNKTWKIRALVTVPVVAVLIALLIIQPWNSHIGPQNVLAKAHDAIAAIESYRFALTRSTDGDITGTYDVEFVSPDRYHVKQTENGETKESIFLGDRQYFNGDFEFFMLLHAQTNSYARMITREATLQWLDRMGDIEELPDEEVEGVRCLHYRGVYDIEKVLRSMEEGRAERGMPPLGEEEFQEELEKLRSNIGERIIELWIGRDDYLLRQMVMDTREPDSNIAHQLTYKFYDFNEPITIEAPLDSSGNLLAGWASTVPERTVFSQDVQASVNNNDPSNRMIELSVTISNTSAGKVTGIEISLMPFSTYEGYEGIWTRMTGGRSGPGPYTLEQGASLEYVITFGYDATTAEPVKIVEAIEGSGLSIGYLTPDGRQKIETVHFQVPGSIYTLPTDLPPSYALSPIGEYRIDEEGASSAGQGVSGEIGGKQYLFVLVGTQNSDVIAPPGILVLNIEDPTRPIKIAYLQAPENTRYMMSSTLSGTMLYVTADDYLWIIDVSSPEAPTELSRFSEVKPITMAISGKYAYVNDGNQRISTVDISDPSDPHVIGGLALTSRSGMSLFISGDYLLAWVGNTLHTIDISSPASLRIINSHIFSLSGEVSAHVTGKAIEGNCAYVALGGDAGTGMSVMDISNPTKPHEIAFLEVKDQQIWGPLFVADNRVYLFTRPRFTLDSRTRINIIDVSDPVEPVELGFGTLPDYWTFFPDASSGSSQSYSLIDKYLYWFIGNSPNQPVIEILDLSIP